MILEEFGRHFFGGAISSNLEDLQKNSFFLEKNKPETWDDKHLWMIENFLCTSFRHVLVVFPDRMGTFVWFLQEILQHAPKVYLNPAKMTMMFPSSTTLARNLWICWKFLPGTITEHFSKVQAITSTRSQQSGPFLLQ